MNTDFTIGNCLFGAKKLTNNADPDECGYNGYGNEFDACSQSSLSKGECGKNVVIVGVDNSSSTHADNRKKDIIILGEGSTDKLDDTTKTTEAEYSVNITKSEKKIYLSLRYNEVNSFLFSNDVKAYQFKAKDSEIKPYPLCWRNILKDFIDGNLKKLD